MNNIILSICIATLNRAEFIKLTLESIIPQISDEVEIVVVDGASTDHTSEVLEYYQKVCPQVRYFRLAEKGGVDRDYDLAVQYARGEYCWLFTDDDVVQEGTINAILKEMRHQYGLIILNAEVKNADLSELIYHTRIPYESNRLYKPSDWELFFIDVAGHLSFIGCVVIKRKLWMSREKEPYWGSEFIHVGVIFQKPLEENIVVLAQPYITIRYGNALWSSRYFEIWMIKWPNILWSFQGISDSAKQLIWPKEPWRNFEKLLFYRAIGAYSKKEYVKYLDQHLESKYAKILSQSIAGLPIKPLNYLYYLLLTLLKRKKSQAFYDINNSSRTSRQ